MEHMTFDDLSELYRVEMNGSSVSQVRRDLFKAMADLLTRLRGEYERQLAIDPDSVMCEGAEHRRKSAERLCKEVVRIRATKICNMAFLGALGSRNSTDMLTEEEKAYYYKVLEASKSHLSETDRLRGKRVTVATHIDEIPVRDLPAERPEPVAPVEEPEAPGEPEEEKVPEPPRPETAPPVVDDQDSFVPEEDDIPDPLDEAPFEPPEQWAEEPEAPISGSDVPADQEDESLKPVLVIVLEDLPEFAGPSRNYKLSKQDLATLPKAMADVLVNTGKATAVDPSP